MLRIPSSISPQHFQSLQLQGMTFVAYRSDIYPDRNEVFFEENAVIFVLEGEKKFVSNTDELLVKKGDILFFQKGCYSMNENLDSKYRSLVFFFHEKQLKEFVSQHINLFQGVSTLAKQPILRFRSDDKFNRFIDSLLPYFGSKTPFLNEFLRLKFQELLLHLLEMDTSKQLAQSLADIYRGQQQDLSFIVNEYFLKPLTINELSRLSGRSLSSFKRAFEQQFNTSPANYIKQKRLEHAQFLLKKTSKNVAEVSLEVGYESVSHFIKAYKEKFGKTPGKG